MPTEHFHDDDVFSNESVQTEVHATPEQEGVDLPVLPLVDVTSDKENLSLELMTDEYLAEARRLADAQDGGFA